MFREGLLHVTLAGDEARARYLGERDRPWVEALLDEAIACQGLCRAETDRRLSLLPGRAHSLAAEAPPQARRALIELLYRLAGFEVWACHPPAELRERVFARAAAARRGHGASATAQNILAGVAGELRLHPEAIARDLYADVPAERRLQRLPRELTVDTLLGRYNLCLAQGLLMRAESLTIEVCHSVKALLRFARLQRLLCLAEPTAHGARLRLSGPLSLFHHTIKYGRAMAAWLPVLVRTPPWRLTARCVLRGQSAWWREDHRAPLGTTHVPVKRFDSQLEERLFRDLRRVAPEWEVLREADPVQIGQRIVCPDFTLVEPGHGRRVPVEVVGFWTPGYLRDKLAILRALPRHTRWLVCVDETLAADEAREIAAGPDVLTFRRRVDARELIQRASRLCGACSPEQPGPQPPPVPQRTSARRV